MNMTSYSHRLIIASLAFLDISLSLCCGSVVTEQFLDRVAVIESGNNPRAVGARGERGAFQLTRAAWTDVNRTKSRRWPYSAARRHDLNRLYARDYLLIQETRLSRALNRAPTAGECYVAFNFGFQNFKGQRFLISRCPAATRAAVKLFE